MYSNKDGLNVLGTTQPMVAQPMVAPRDFRYNAISHLRFGISPEESYKQYMNLVNTNTRVPLLGAKSELKNLKKKLLDTEIKEKMIGRDAETISKLYNYPNKKYIESILLQYGSLEKTLMAIKNGLVPEISRTNGRPLARPLPRRPTPSYSELLGQIPIHLGNIQPQRSKDNEMMKVLASMVDLQNRTTKAQPTWDSEMYLKQIISDMYPRESSVYRKQDEIAKYMDQYMKLAEIYKVKTKNIQSRSRRLAQLIGTTTNIEPKILHPFVETMTPLLERKIPLQ